MHLDDRQLRDKLAKAGSDMPHVDLWPHLHQEAAAIADVAQQRRRGAGFSPFTATRLLAPAFALLLVLAASLTSLQGHEQRITGNTPALTTNQGDASAERAAAYNRRMAVGEARALQLSASQGSSPSDSASASGHLTDLDAARLAARDLRRELGFRPVAAQPLVRARPGPQTE